ncbi:MAG: acyl-CoA dehydrogenase family protein, partial [Novosphingobium sp.]|nr:acyl-CoA dehydrogenase family protein [Novosphingobium sp.]
YPSADPKLWFERMAARGWTVPTWPKEYGGGGLSATQARILAEEMDRIKAAPPLQSLGILMLGPALMKFATEEQKREHLPRIARGEIRWAQGYSEPGAGSDLASLQTRAEDKGDHFLVNGQKIWTTYGHKCDWIFTLVRTDPDAPKQAGISFLLIDMASPGVEARPIRQISGNTNFSETFFTDVRVPKANLVGKLNHGWEVAKYLLTFERTTMGSFGSGRNEESLDAAALRLLGREGLAREPHLRQEIAEILVEGWALRIANRRLMDQVNAKLPAPFAPAVLKVLASELELRRTRALMALGGFDHFDAQGSAAYKWLDAPTYCIAGGTNEIQLNILSKRALELPEV